MDSIAVLLTCHNRKEKTLACLESLYQCVLPNDVNLSVYLTDDGSKDGTKQDVHAQYPNVIVLSGNGNLFWNGGMNLAFSEAITYGYDYYLWLNDDSKLYPGALKSLMSSYLTLKEKHFDNVIIVGSMQDPNTQNLTYGGVTRPNHWNPVSFKYVEPGSDPIRCDTMDGNCVFIPNSAVEKIGNLDPVFTHAMGDYDYGLRAYHAGISVWVMPGYAGVCANNATTGNFTDVTLPLALRLHKMMQPKGLPLNDWRIFTQRHAGLFWFVFWLWPYIKVTATSLLKKQARL